MKEKELRKLNRKQLLELLLLQVKENESLKEENASLRRILNRREIMLSEAGNIAEAVVRLNDIFAIAQQTADQYVENVKHLCDKRQADAPGAVDAAVATDESTRAD